MVKNGYFWSIITICIFTFLLWLNYSAYPEYIKIRKYPNTDLNTAVTCKSFITQKDAQDFFIKNGGIKTDKYNLDGDKDGKVCESLP